MVWNDTPKNNKYHTKKILLIPGRTYKHASICILMMGCITSYFRLRCFSALMKNATSKKRFLIHQMRKIWRKHTHLLSNFWNCSKNMFLSIRNRILFLVTFILLKRKTSSAHFRPIDLSSCYLDIYLYLNSFFLCQGKNLGNYKFF